MKGGLLFCCRLLLPLILLTVAVSCRTGHSSESANRVTVQYVSLHTRDSIFLHDSVRVREKADTVFVTRIRTLYRDRVRVDTLWLRDTMRLVINEIKRPEKVNRFSWSTVAVLLPLILFLWRSGLLSLLRRLIEKFIK